MSFGVFASILFNLGVSPPGRGTFHVTGAGRANLCGVVGCFRGEKPPLPEVGPPEQSQRDLRRPLAQSRPNAAPQKKLSPSQPSFPSLFASQTTRRAPTTSRLRSKVRSLYPRRCCQRGASGLRQPTQEIPRATAS